MSNYIYLPFVVNDIQNPGSHAFSLEENALQGFVVRQEQEVVAYLNKCPHTGASLNWQEHVFLDRNEELIQCAMHGALFSIATGRCLRGPCVGQSLQKLDLLVDDDGKIAIRV